MYYMEDPDQKLPVEMPDSSLKSARERWSKLCQALGWEVCFNKKRNDQMLGRGCTDLKAIYSLKKLRIPVAHPTSISLPDIKANLTREKLKSLQMWEYKMVEKFIRTIDDRLKILGNDGPCR